MAARWNDDVLVLANHEPVERTYEWIGVRVAANGSSIATWPLTLEQTDQPWSLSCTSSACRIAYTTLDRATGRRRVAILELTLTNVSGRCGADGECGSWICDLGECAPPGSMRHDGGVPDASASLDGSSLPDGSASADGGAGMDRHPGLTPGGGGNCMCRVGRRASHGWVMVGLSIGCVVAGRRRAKRPRLVAQSDRDDRSVMV